MTTTEISTKEMLQETEETTRQLLVLLSSFNQAQLNKVPAEGGWSAGQIAEHLIKASIVSILYGPVKPSQRPPDQAVEGLKTQFLDFSIQMTSPDFILPAAPPHDKEAIVQALENIGSQVREAIQTLDLSAICMDAPAELGELTRLELIHFHLYHTQRHVHQLQKLLQPPRS